MEPPKKPEPELVESGHFRVDPTGALKKLAEFQLARPETFLLPCVRCAVASGAKRIDVRLLPGGLELSFDGKPLPEAQLKDPYAPLLLEGPEFAAARHLAIGLLSVSRLEPISIALASGSGGKRRTLQVQAPGLSPSPEPLAQKGSALQIRWGGFSADSVRDKVLEALSEGYGMTDTRLFIEGKALEAWPAAEAKSFRFQEKGIVGCILPEPERPRVSSVRYYALGACVSEVDLPSATPLLEARVACKDFRLNLSQSGVVQDDVHHRAEAALRDCIERHSREMGRPRWEVPTNRRGDWSDPREWADLAAAIATVGLPFLLFAVLMNDSVFMAEAYVFHFGTGNPALVRLGASLLALALPILYCKLTGRLKHRLLPVRIWQPPLLALTGSLLMAYATARFTGLQLDSNAVRLEFAWPRANRSYPYGGLQGLRLERRDDADRAAWRLVLLSKKGELSSVWGTREPLATAAHRFAESSGLPLSEPAPDGPPRPGKTP